jgi:molybdopterin molybdotransferase
MDGYAVKSVDILSASEEHPISLRLIGEVPMGSPVKMAIQNYEAALIHTGE